MKRKSILILPTVLIFFIILAVVSLMHKSPEHHPPVIGDGFIDLSNWDFEKNGSVMLEGKWAFYFNQFLTPVDFMNGNGQNPLFISIPSTKKSMDSIKPFPENKFYGTMRITVKLPNSLESYGLRSNIVMSSYKLFINGRLYGEVGKVGTTKESSVPYRNTMYTYFTEKNNTLEIIYHTSDLHFGDPTIATPMLGLASDISKEARMALARDLFLFGMLLIMGIYHIGLYTMRTKDLSPLFFGVFCLSFSLRLLIVGERFLPNQLIIPYILYARLAYACVFVGISALLGFLYYTLDGLFPKWFLRIGLYNGLLIGLGTFLSPYEFLDILLVIYACVGLPLLAYAVVRIIYGVYKQYESATGVLIGFLCLGVTLINDMIYQLTLANKPSMIPLGVAVFIFTQAYTLSARFSSAFTQAEQLSAENAAILIELKDMNSNLESIVDERTADLKNAMQEMDTMSKIDYLTKLPNRRLMFQNIDKLIEEKRHFFIALADIDKFKVVNDTFGHDKGDEILKGASNAMVAALDSKGFVSRWGGEEFLLVLFSNDPAEALEIAKMVCDYVANCKYETVDAQITLTMGLCYFSEGQSVDTCIANADNALYVGKANGRNQCHMYGAI